MKRNVLIILLALFMVAAYSLPILNPGVEVQAASNPYPTTQDWDGDGNYEVPCTRFAWQCAYDRMGKALPSWGNAVNWWDGARNAGYATGSTPKANSIAVWKGDGAGHVAYVTSGSGNTFTVDEGGRTDLDHTSSHGVAYGYTLTNAVGGARPGDTGKTLLGFIYLVETETLGSTMSVGYDRVIPDGDYIIANSRHTDSQNQQLYYLDVKGYDTPAANSTNVQLYDDKADNIPASDVWTVKYNDADKFYTITQKGTNMALDVYNNGNKPGTNVNVYQKSGTWGGVNQKWAITWVEDYGFRIQAKTNSGYLDVYNNGNARGTNVQLWKKNENTNTSQVWEFIPYKPPQVVANGTYKIVSGLSSNLTLDVDGTSSNVENLTNVQVWNYPSDADSDSFDVKKLPNGYYSIVHSASGKSLDVRGGFSNAATWRYANISMYDKHGGLNQQFAITKCNDGYIIRPRCSGLVVDVEGSKTDDGTNVRQTQYWGGAAQVWKFVPYDGTPPTIRNAKIVDDSGDTIVIEADVSDNNPLDPDGNYITTNDGTKTNCVWIQLHSKVGNDYRLGSFNPRDTYEWISDSRIRITFKKSYLLTENNKIVICARDKANNITRAELLYTYEDIKKITLHVGQTISPTEIWSWVSTTGNLVADYNINNTKDYSYYGNALEYDTSNNIFTAKNPGKATLYFSYYSTASIAAAEVRVECSSHSWDAGVITRAATASSEGVKTYTCTVCDATRTETIPKVAASGGDPSSASASAQKADPGNDPNKFGSDGTPIGAGASASAAERAITSSASEEGPAGSKYGILALRSTKQTKKSIKLTWKGVSGATSYVIYGSACGKNNRMKKIATVSGKSYTAKKAGKVIRKGTYYKFMVVALDGNNMVKSTSKVIHVATKGGKVGNHKKVTVKKSMVKKAKKLKAGKSLKLKVKAVKAKLKVKQHRSVAYESSNSAVATVSKKGVVKGVSKGTCYIYAYAQNGVYKRIKVTVR